MSLNRPPYHGGYADTDANADVPPIASLFPLLRAVELEFDHVSADSRRALDRRREAARNLAAVQRNREICEATHVARRTGFEDGRAHQRAIAQHDRWYWLGVGVLAGVVLFGGLVLQFGRHGGALL